MASEYRPAERRGASEARGSRRGTHGAEEAARFAAVRHFISPRFVRAPEGSGAPRRKIAARGYGARRCGVFRKY